MKTLSIALFIILVTIYSCDLRDPCNDYACYSGAPELGVEFIFNEGVDSSYLLIDKWSISDGGEEVRIRYEEDSIWDSSIPYMNLILSDSSVTFYGSGVAWNNLDDLASDLIIDFGNQDLDTLDVTIGVSKSECCESNYIEQVLHNGEELTQSDSWFYQTTF